MTGAYTFEAEIRNKADHESNAMEDDVGATVLEDKLHDRPYPLTGFDRVRVYVEDTHDQPFNVDLETAPADSDGFSGAVSHDSLTVPAGAYTATRQYGGPLGKFRFTTSYSGAGTDPDPASGSIRVTVYGWP